MRKPTFAPLDAAKKSLMSAATGVDVRDQDMNHWFCCTAYSRNGQVGGLLACEPVSKFEWAFNVVVLDPHVLTRRLLGAIFAGLFHGSAVRVSADVRDGNDRAIKQMIRFGFTYEGFKRLGLEGRFDAQMFSMLRWECPWIAQPALPERYVDAPPRAEMH